MNRGILDIAGKLPKFTIPEGKTLDDLINEATEESAVKEMNKYKIRVSKKEIPPEKSRSYRQSTV